MMTVTLSRARSHYAFLFTPKAVFGLLMIGALIVAGVFGPWIAPFDPARQDLMMAMTPPQLTGPHFLGTDHVCRDLLSRIIYGARVSLLIAIAVVLFSGVFGVALGIVSGYFGGRTDSLIQKFLEVFWAFPPRCSPLPSLPSWARD